MGLLPTARILSNMALQCPAAPKLGGSLQALEPAWVSAKSSRNGRFPGREGGSSTFPAIGIPQKEISRRFHAKQVPKKRQLLERICSSDPPQDMHLSDFWSLGPPPNETPTQRRPIENKALSSKFIRRLAALPPARSWPWRPQQRAVGP